MLVKQRAHVDQEEAPMNDTPSEPSRNTFWSLLPQLRSWPVALVVLALLALVGMLLALLTFNYVRDAAEPGSVIKLLGLEVQVRKPAPAPPDTTTYNLPQGRAINEPETVPILDGSIAIGVSQTGFHTGARTAVLVGDGLQTIGAREPDGKPIKIWLDKEDPRYVRVDIPAYIEVERLGNVFGITTKYGTQHGEMLFSVEKKPIASLRLMPVKELSQ